HPPIVQAVSRRMHETDLMMSDMPWAVAWYGKRQCVWLTLNSESEFFALSDLIKPVRALYLTPLTLKDKNALSERWKEDEAARAQAKAEGTWGWFVAEVLVNRQIPKNFPLQRGWSNFLPDHLFLADWEAWRNESTDKR